MACVALPTCGLAMAEAERYLPDFLERVGKLLERHGLADEPINVRITGCPNGCARPYVAEDCADRQGAGALQPDAGRQPAWATGWQHARTGTTWSEGPDTRRCSITHARTAFAACRRDGDESIRRLLWCGRPCATFPPGPAPTDISVSP
jgi:hypothetical protein